MCVNETKTESRCIHLQQYSKCYRPYVDLYAVCKTTVKKTDWENVKQLVNINWRMTTVVTTVSCALTAVANEPEHFLAFVVTGQRL